MFFGFMFGCSLVLDQECKFWTTDDTTVSFANRVERDVARIEIGPTCVDHGVTDISSRADIDRLMRRFYGRAMSDPLIGYLFTDVAKLDLEHHLPVIGDFWESTLFGTGVYARHRRNPLMIHLALDAKESLQPEHFQRWLALFDDSVDESFSGARAVFAKQRGRAVAARIQEYLGGARQK